MSSDAPSAPRVPPSAAAHGSLADAYVLGGNRVPFAKAHGPYAALSEQQLLTATIDALVARYGLQGERLGEVVAGAVLKHSRDFNLTREAVLGSALAPTTPAHDLQRACATGLEAAISVANKVRLGQLDAGIAGGADSISDAPIAVSDGLRKALLRATAARSLGARLRAFASIRTSDLAPAAPRTDEPRTGLSMGEHQAITTAQWGITRTAQDDLALASHQRLAAAWDSGFFDDLVTPLAGLTRDQFLRADSSLEKLSTLTPVFGKQLAGVAPTMTAGNSTPLTDGASAVLIGSGAWAAEHAITPLARIVDSQVAAVDYVHGHDGLLMAPVAAVAQLLERQGMTLQDFDFYEIHEAFAATVLCHLAAWESQEYCQRELGRPALGAIDRSRLNVHGSSLAAGHPFAATGGRILATAAATLAAAQRDSAATQAQRDSGATQAQHDVAAVAPQQRPPGGASPSPGAALGSRPLRTLVSVCAAGGIGVAMILESVPTPPRQG